MTTLRSVHPPDPSSSCNGRRRTGIARGAGASHFSPPDLPPPPVLSPPSQLRVIAIRVPHGRPRSQRSRRAVILSMREALRESGARHLIPTAVILAEALWRRGAKPPHSLSTRAAREHSAWEPTAHSEVPLSLHASTRYDYDRRYEQRARRMDIPRSGHWAYRPDADWPCHLCPRDDGL
jgi:ribosomal protein L31E